jgi:hypothetical protein
MRYSNIESAFTITIKNTIKKAKTRTLKNLKNILISFLKVSELSTLVSVEF